MRPRLNLSLRRALMAAMATACTLLSTTAWGGVMHDDVSFQTYTDFGQNRGRYVVGSQVNELLSYIRSDKVDNGIVIHYQAGGSYTISNEQGMINFGGTHDQGHSAVISPTFIATVFHNGSLNASVGERWVGESHAINYDGVDIRGSNVFRLAPDNGNGVEYDYMIQRQSKIVTDATWNTLTTLTSTEINNLDGSYIYHSGSGTQYVWLEEEGRMKSLCGAYQYIIGAINTITNGQIHGNTTNLSLHQQPDYSNGGDADSDTDNPLPNGIRAGDSGSPTYIYNTQTGQYEYIAAQQSGGGSSYGQARGDVEWTNTTLESFNARVDLSATNTVQLNAISITDAEADHIVDNLGNSTQIYHGVATDAAGNEIASYRGIQSGVNTWGDLSGIKNNDTWYAYGSSYLKQKDADLFFNDNLVFTATNGNEYSIVLNDTVDLGVGYVEFNKGEGDWEKAIFTITSEEGENNRLNSAGFVINEDAEVHLRVNNPDTHMTEWRKNGAGNLYIDGTGDTNALLTVGGSGTTYLQQTGGYAAYNVLASSGANVVIKDLAQIERDFTFGVGGGVLDMNGNNMDWYTSTDGEGRFTIHALTEEAIITNSSSTAVNLTYKEAGNQTFKGSFVADSGKSLNITYDGGGTWTLNSIHTRLSANSSFTVNNGTVILKGTNTVHGLGSTNGLPSGGRLNNPNDWHYADATMDVMVANGATFELGSHARLTGTVYVEDGGTFVLREGVKHRYEYVEGGAVTEDTYKYAQFYGLHNTSSDGVYLGGSDASMQVAFSEGTTANTTIAAKLSGKGSISVAAGTAGGTLTLSGDNRGIGDNGGLSGTKTLISGGLIADTNNSLGNTTTNKWVVNQEAWIASHEFTSADNIFTHIDASSTGTLALSNNIKSQLAELSGTHKNMTLGAEVGKTVNYGTAGTSDTLTAVDGVWKLGGGGGELVVNFVLAGDNTLMLGNHAAAQGTVTLTNNNADFSGDITFSGTGITLKATNENAFGSAKVALDYGNVLALGSVSNYGLIKDGSTGVLALASSQDVDLSNHKVTLGALGEVEYEGSLSATKDGSYRIGGSGHLIFTNPDTFSGSDQMYIDGQGLSGSAVTFARANAYTGNIVAGGGLQLASVNSSGDVTIHLGYRDSLASASSVLLQKGASLQFDALATATVQNLSVQSGASLVNNGFDDTTVTLNVTDTHRSSIVSSALSGNKLHLVKTGSGTLYMSSTQSESWTGGLTIKEGTVEADIHSSGWTNFGGVGSSSNVVAVEKGATLKLNAEARYGYNLAGTALPQMVVGSGTIELSSGGAVVYGNSKFDFDGTIKISGGTRLYVGSKLQMNNRQITYNNLAAVNGTTVEIEAGSQVRVTSSLQYLTDEKVTTSADFIINGQGYTGKDSSEHKEGYTNNALYQADLHDGALSLDAASTVTGNITLATDAAIASWSEGNLVTSTVADQSVQGAVPYACHTRSSYSSYRLKGHLGGTVRGLILGVEEADGSMSDLTLVGNETLTFTADSANTYGDLVINNGNGNEDDKVALKLDGGASLSQISTALGTGSVTLNAGLILRLAGTGVENNSDVVYTYENDMSVGDGATLQSYNITNRLANAVVMSGDSLNLATAHGGVLELAGGINGSGTLNVAAGSKVILGSAGVGYAMARTGNAQFSGTVAAGDGADITMASPAVVAADTAFTGTDNLTLRLSGTEDFTLGSISLAGSQVTVDEVTTTTPTSLSLYFDFSAVPDAADAATWSTLTVTDGITADRTTIGLTLNVDNDIASGSYALISGVSSTEGYSLADTLGNRLSLKTEGGNLVLVVDADGRLYWRSSGENWNTTEAHWYKQASGDTLTTFSDGADVVFDASGVAQDNSAATPEQVVLNESVSVGKMSVKGAAYTISGTGAVAGQSLVVSGGAEAVLNLSAEAGSSFTTGGVTIDDATLTLQGTSLAAAATVQNGGTLALNSAAKLTGNVIVESGARFTADNATLTGKLTVREADAALSNSSTVSGNVSVREGSITIDGSTVTGSFSGVGKGSAVLNNATLTTTDGWEFSELKNKFTLNAAASGTISWDVADGYLTLGSLTTTGNLSTTQDTTSAGEMVFLGISSIGCLEGKMGTLTIGLDADHTAFLTVNSTEFSDNSNVGAVTLNINEGSTFKVTSAGTQGSYASNGIRIGEWSSSTTVNVDGALLATNSSLQVGDTTSYVNIGSTGVLAVKGIRNNVTSKSSGVVLTMEDGGKLIVGSENVATNVAFTATLNGGTIASSADATMINGALTANGSLEIDTNRYDFATDGNSIARGTAASTITMQGSLSGECALSVSGSGKLALQNDGSAFTGSIALKDTATLSVNSTSAGILSGVSSLAVNSGTLDLSALDFNTETQPTIALSAEASFSFTENSTVAFGTMNEDTWYNVFDTNAYGAALDGWESLSVSNFTINGVSMADMGRITLTTVESGGLFYYTIDRYDLVWNGAESGTWNTTDVNWQTTRPNAETGADETISTAFVNNDNVTFNSSATVSVASGVIVNNLNITNNAQVTLNTTALTANNVSIASGSKLTAQAFILVPVKAFDIAAGATLETSVPGTPVFTAEVTCEGAVTMTGGGTLTWNAADGSLSIAELNINGGGTFKTTSAYTGTTVNITNGSAQFDGDVSIDTMNVAAGKTVTLWNAAAASGADKNISTLHLANGAKLQTNDRDTVTSATTIGTLNLTGSSATLQDVNHSGWIAVHNITGGADSTLNLVKNAKSNNVGIFTLGDAEGTTESGSAFAGTISVKQATVTGNGQRDVALLLNHATVAQAATIDLNSATTSADASGRGAYVGLGVNVASATIGGLKSGQALGERAILFSGSQASNAAWADKSATTEKNTLTISPASGTTHEYYGKVQNVNLVIDGAGTQKFLGTTNAGSIGVENGTLILGCAATADTVNISGGTMKVNFTSADGATITDNASGSFTVGTLNYTGGTLEMSGTVDIITLKVGGGLTATVYNNGANAGQNKTFGTVELGAGATLVTYDSAQPSVATKLGTVKLTGTTATIQDKWNSGYTAIENLIGEADDTLNLVKYAKSTAVGVFSLGGSNTTEVGSAFAGTIALKQIENTGQRDVALILNHKTIAQNATVDLQSIHSGASTKLGLGVNVAAATIGGLKSGSAVGDMSILFSGAMAANKTWENQTMAATPNTLTINTANGATHEYYGQVQNVNLVIDGEGTQKFLGTSDSFSGSVTVQGGTAAFNAAGTSLLEHATDFTLTDGVLDLSAISFGTDNTHAISLASGATFSFGGDGTIALGELEAGTTYQIFDMTNGSLSGWTDLAADNVRMNGVQFDAVHATVQFGETGTFSYSLQNIDNLIWAGGASGTWDQATTNWDATPDVADDANIIFMNGDGVTFNADAAVTLSSVISANTVTIADGATVRLDESAGKLSATSIIINEASTLAFETAQTGFVKNISGTGTVELSSLVNASGNEDWGVQLKLDGFEGTTYVKAGKFDLYKSTAEFENDATETLDDNVALVGGTLHLGSGAHLQIASGKSVVLNANVVIDQNTTGGVDSTVDGTEVHNNGSASLTVNGTVTGEGTWHRKGGGSLTFANTVDLGGFIATSTNQFNAATSLDTFTISGGTTSFAADATIAEATISGGTVKSAGVNFGKTGGTLTMTGGSLEFNKTGNNATQTLLSTLVVGTANTASTVYVKNNGSTGDNMTRVLTNVSVAANNTLELQQQTWNTVWDIRELSGAGNLTWQASTNHNKSTILKVSGDGSDFTGVLKVVRNYSEESQNTARPYQAFLQLDSDAAVQGAVVNLDVTSTTTSKAHIAMAVNTSNAKLQGLVGDEYTHLYAGSAREDATNKNVPASTANKTLTITGSDDYTFAGTVGAVGESAHLNLSMEGSGSQTFSGAAHVGNVNLSNGTLTFSHAGSVIHGDVSIAAGGAALTAATTATVDEDGNVTAASEEWARITSTSDTAAATVSGAAITQTEGEKALSIASRSTDGTRGTMANTLVQIAQGASLTVENMVIGSNSSLRGQAQVAYAARSVEAAQASINNSTIELSADNDSIVGSTQAMTLTQLQPIGTSDTTGALTLSGSSNVLTVTSFALSDLVLTSGTNFVVDFSSLLSWEELADVDFVALSFNNVSYADLENTTIGGLLDPSTNLTAYYDSTVNAPVSSIYFDVRAIPEPTSTTLSILALAALAARRRRK